MFVVGLQGIEPCLYAPEAYVLPVYYSPFTATILKPEETALSIF